MVLPEYVQKELARTELTRQLFVSDIGVFPHARNHYRERPEGADAHIFIYCIEGRGIVEKAGEDPLELSPGIMAVIPAGVPHRYWASEEDPWSIYWFHVKGEHVGELCVHYGLGHDAVRMPRTFVSEFIARLDQTLAILTDRPYSIPSHIYVSQTLRWLISGLGRELLHTHQDRKREHHLENAIRYMEEHIASSIRLPELAAYTGISKQHLIYLFNKETGFAPIDYFLRMKMQHAANMLDLTGLTVKEIAASIGMEDPYYFSRMFKKLMGHAPTDYRRIPKG
ncbi:helix-turn-helix domain-containing protein [Gorillibacterium sp. sgz5001074]|uniref:helix-turn-helix domain-containing protein n=1 Tax=Gorillibacterium sp. sgz5001074 TaxID=3446695 RepID=UPI003F67CE90